MQFIPGRRVTVRHRESGSSAEASILDVTEKGFALLLSTGLALDPGDEVELELCQWEDALYLCQAVVTDVGENKARVLLGRAGLRRMQRRRSERMHTNLSAEYVLRPNNRHGVPREGRIKDISRHGVLLAAKEPLPLGEKLLLTFELTLEREVAVTTGLRGEVVREHAAAPGEAVKWKYCYGVEFAKPLAALPGTGA